MSDMCTDNRFELIEKFKKKLIESTNIETSPEEMKVIDNILFRFWQMGWLDNIDRMPSAQPEIIRCKDCNKASKCYGDVIMRSRGGGYIYCPLEFCSAAERRTDE